MPTKVEVFVQAAGWMAALVERVTSAHYDNSSALERPAAEADEAYLVKVAVPSVELDHDGGVGPVGDTREPKGLDINRHAHLARPRKLDEWLQIWDGLTRRGGVKVRQARRVLRE